MKTEIIGVGNEILIGNIESNNATYLARKCAAMGLTCLYQTVVPDNKDCIVDVLKLSFTRSEMIFVCGGLGDAEDDYTKAAVKEALGVSTDSADVRVLENKNGKTAGYIFEKEGRSYILLPGYPIEMISMFENDVLSYVKSKSENYIETKIVKLCGITEEEINKTLEDIMKNKTNPVMSTLVKTGEIHIQITAKGKDEKDAARILKPVITEIKTRLNEYIYTTEEDVELENAVVDLLIANELNISCAESCTGGMLSARLINVPGVSDTLKATYVTYSNKSKRKILGVKKSTLQTFGAVSAETAEEMVKGLASISKADVNLAVTGFAGPDAGGNDKPVGLVYIACKVKQDVVVNEYHFKGNRQKIRVSATKEALILARKCLLTYFSKMTFGNQ